MATRCVESPLGPLFPVSDGQAITALHWGTAPKGDTSAPCPVLDHAAEELSAYFAGDLQGFTVPVQVQGSAFQRSVCDAMRAIPFGQTRTYGQIAKALGAPAQAVGQACGGNPVPILIPCHRVVGAQGLGGFSGGIGTEDKVWLLRHEGGLLL